MVEFINVCYEAVEAIFVFVGAYSLSGYLLVKQGLLGKIILSFMFLIVLAKVVTLF